MNGNSAELKLPPKAKTIKMRSTKPASTVRPNEVKIEAIINFLFLDIN